MASSASTESSIEAGRAPRAFNVVRDPSPELLKPIDWSRWYLDEEDDVGESPAQTVIIRALVSVCLLLLRERGKPAGFLGVDNFFAWVPDHPRVRVSPDVYWIEGELPDPLPGMWQTWCEGQRPPRWAVEIVSSDWRKDYDEIPQKYAQLGVEELVVFDPEAARGATRIGERVALQIYRRHADGSFVRQPASERYLRSFDIHLAIDTSGEVPLLRFARDAEGREIIQSMEEYADEVSQLLEREAQRAEEAARLLEEMAQRVEEATRRAAEEAQRAEQEAQRAEQEAQRAEQATRLAREEAQRAVREAQRAQQEALRADEATRQADEEARRADAASQRADQATQRADAATQRADQATQRADQAARRADEEARRAERNERALEAARAALAALRAQLGDDDDRG